MDSLIVDNAKVMSKGQITLPKDMRTRLGIETGDRVALVCEGDQIILMNAAVYAMKMLQQGMIGMSKESGLSTDESVNTLVMDIRSEVEDL